MENMSLARKNTISEMNMNIDPAGDQPVTSVAVQDTPPHTHQGSGKGRRGKTRALWEGQDQLVSIQVRGVGEKILEETMWMNFPAWRKAGKLQIARSQGVPNKK